MEVRVGANDNALAKPGGNLLDVAGDAHLILVDVQLPRVERDIRVAKQVLKHRRKHNKKLNQHVTKAGDLFCCFFGENAVWDIYRVFAPYS